MSRRAKGDGSVHEETWTDADGTKRTRWVGELDLGPDPATGKRRRRKVRAATQQGAARKVRDLRREIDAGLDVSRRAPTVEVVVREWLDAGAPGPRGAKQASTMARLTRRLEDHVIPGVGHLPIDELRPEHIETWLRREADAGQRRSTLLDYRSDLRQVLNWALRRRRVTWNAASVVSVPDGAPSIAKKALSRVDRERLYRTLDGDRMGSYFVLIAELGVRPGEADALRWTDVDLEAGVLHIEQSIKRVDGGEAIGVGPPKTAKSMRSLALTDRCIAALRSRRVEQATERLRAGSVWCRDERWDDLVFTSEVGTPIHPSNSRRSLAKLCRAAKVPEVTPYELRHTAATLLAEDVRLIDVADQLGHTDTRMVERVYRHRPDVIRTAADVERRRATS
jgi:integrase